MTNATMTRDEAAAADLEWENNQPWPGDEVRGMSFPKVEERPAPYKQTDEEFAAMYLNTTHEEDLIQQAAECAAEAGMDAYYTSVHNGASHAASLSLAHGATCPDGDDGDDGPTEEEREAINAQEQLDRYNYEDPCVARWA